VLRVIAPVLLIAGIVWLQRSPAGYWTRCYTLLLAAGFVFCVAALVGRGRTAATVIGSLVVGLAAYEAYALIVQRAAIDVYTPGYSVPHPVLGWAPEHPGVYHHTKTNRRIGRIVIDIDYTIDDHLTRKVESAADKPTIAFLGASYIFGVGVVDADTLPQAFADATGRHFHVVNLAFVGYAPQHYLRILETGLHDDILTQPRAFIVPAWPQLVDWLSCSRGFTLPGPRYELHAGNVEFAGTCAERWSLPLRGLFAMTSLHDELAPRLDYRTPAQKLDLFVAVMARIQQVVREKYAAPLVVPYLRDPYALRDGRYTDDQVMQRLRENGLAVVDVTLNTARYPGQELLIPGEGHPNGAANRIIAALILDALAQRGLATP
jgi:hypothetical protein